MVRGLPENNEKEDQDLSSELLKDIGCQQVEIASTIRLGRKEDEYKNWTTQGYNKKNQQTKDEMLRNNCKIETG